MKKLLTVLSLVLLPMTVCAAGTYADPRERVFPADYREGKPGPPPGEEIRKYAEDQPGRPQQNFGVQPIHDNEVFATFRADRLEYQWREHDKESVLWDVMGWVGADYNKLYLESEGEWSETEDKVEEAEIKLLYGRSISTFWNLRAGIRHDLKPDPDRTFATLGVLGLAPLWFEVDANAYLSEDGDISADLEVEYEILLSQRLRLVPRLETAASVQDVPEYETWQGITDITLGARLMYQIRREFAPYVGVSWSRKVGETAHNLDKEGMDIESGAVVAGGRFWF